MRRLFQREGVLALRALLRRGRLSDVKKAIRSTDKLWLEQLLEAYQDMIADLAEITVGMLGGRIRKSGRRGRATKADPEVTLGDFPDTEGAEWEFDPWTPNIQRYVRRELARKITHVTNTTIKRVANDLGPMIERQDSMDAMAAKLQARYAEFGERRAYVIARTEAHSAMGFAQQEAAQQSGAVETKTWLNSNDDRVRDLHLSQEDGGVSGETVPLMEPFSNGLLYPGDPQGTARETVNCRCVCLYGVEP